MKEYPIFHGGGSGKNKQRLHHREFSNNVVSARVLNTGALYLPDNFHVLIDRFYHISHAALTVTARSVS